MAYKSQVTNKYMGSSFAGRVNAGRENELTQLVKSLNTLSDAVPKGISVYQDKQIEKAEEHLEYLKTTMSPEDLNAHILEGNDPILSNKWATSVVEGNVGRFQAGEVISKIRENMGNYDYEKQTLREFYAPQIPDMASKSSAYKNGFSVAFNNWSANEYMKDADMRGKKAEEKKVNNVVKFLDNTVTDMDDYWETLNSFNSQLPNTAGQENKYMTNDQLNDAALQHAKLLVQSATQIEHFDKAMTILTSDRGVGKNGQQLGSLLSTKREDVSNLKAQIIQEQFRFENQEIQRNNWKEQEEIKTILLDTFTDLDITNTESINSARKSIQMIDPSFTPTFDKLVNLERNVAVSEGDKAAFLLSIADGDYDDDAGRMFKDFENGQYPFSMLTTALGVWGSAHTRIANGEKQIYETNKTYVDGTTIINNSIKRSFQSEFGGIDENYNEAIRLSTFYIQSSIVQFEASGNKTPEERRLFMKDLGDYVSQMYSKEMVTDPVLGNFQNVTAINQEAAENNTSLENVVNTMVQQVPQFNIDELVTPNLGDINLADIDAVNKASGEYLRANVYPDIAKAVINQIPPMFQDNLVEFFDALSTPNFDAIAEAMGIEPTQLFDAMKPILQGNN